MKKLLLSLTLATVAAAAQAGDTPAACPFMESAKSSCCSGKSCDQMKTSAQAKSDCCSAVKVSVKAKPAKAQVLMSPKAAAEIASK